MTGICPLNASPDASSLEKSSFTRTQGFVELWRIDIWLVFSMAQCPRRTSANPFLLDSVKSLDREGGSLAYMNSRADARLHVLMILTAGAPLCWT